MTLAERVKQQFVGLLILAAWPAVPEQSVLLASPVRRAHHRPWTAEPAGPPESLSVLAPGHTASGAAPPRTGYRVSISPRAFPSGGAPREKDWRPVPGAGRERRRYPSFPVP